MAYETTTTTVAKRRGRPPGTATKKRKYTRSTATARRRNGDAYAVVQDYLSQIETLTAQLETLAFETRGAYRVLAFNRE